MTIDTLQPNKDILPKKIKRSHKNSFNEHLILGNFQNKEMGFLISWNRIYLIDCFFYIFRPFSSWDTLCRKYFK